MYKIKYTLNIIPSLLETHISLMDVCDDTEELEMFGTKTLQTLI
jgi:hypothetical protein